MPAWPPFDKEICKKSVSNLLQEGKEDLEGRVRDAAVVPIGARPVSPRPLSEQLRSSPPRQWLSINALNACWVDDVGCCRSYWRRQKFFCFRSTTKQSFLSGIESLQSSSKAQSLEIFEDDRSTDNVQSQPAVVFNERKR